MKSSRHWAATRLERGEQPDSDIQEAHVAVAAGIMR
jgi:hypothetical protein